MSSDYRRSVSAGRRALPPAGPVGVVTARDGELVPTRRDAANFNSILSRHYASGTIMSNPAADRVLALLDSRVATRIVPGVSSRLIFFRNSGGQEKMKNRLRGHAPDLGNPRPGGRVDPTGAPTLEPNEPPFQHLRRSRNTHAESS